MTEKQSYNNIFKTTFLFSFVRIFQIIAGIIKNKVIAILLGAEGVGIIGILSNSVQLIQSGAGLGISQSAVRDISEANYSKDHTRFSRIIFLTKRVILFTCLLGCIITVILSPLLSKWTFGDKNYTLAYICMAFVVGLNILTEGQLAILKGMRQMHALAKASIIGSIVGLVSALPMYYYFGKEGIVPSLIITAISAVFFSNLFVRKIKYERMQLGLKDFKKEASPMVKMGLALMIVGFLGLLFDLVIISYVRSHGGIEVVGYYRAGTTIISSYFGIVLTSMTTDYYPRISSIFRDNGKLQDELNRQSEVGLVLIFPIAIIFVFLSPVFIQFLYSKDFIRTILYTDYAIIGTVIALCSNNMGMILIAKQEAKIVTIYSIAHRILFLPIYLLLYNKFNLYGLGISYFVDAFVQFIIYYLIIKHKYAIKLKKTLLMQFALVLFVIIVVLFIRSIETLIIKYLIGGIFMLFSCVYSYFFLRKVTNLNLLDIFNKFRKRN